jgi:hypothetical protein
MQSCGASVKSDLAAPAAPLLSKPLLPGGPFGAGQRLGEFEQAAAQGWVLDPVVGTDQLDGFAPSQGVGVERFSRWLGKPCWDRGCSHRIHVVEEKRDRYVQHPTQIMQSAGADAIGAALVFLNLLKRQPDRLPELFLTQTEHIPAEPNSGADMDIDRVWLVAFSATRASYRLVHRHRDCLQGQRSIFDKAGDRLRSTTSVNESLKVAFLNRDLRTRPDRLYVRRSLEPQCNWNGPKEQEHEEDPVTTALI